MHEPTHAPGWRGRPRRVGPIADDKPTGNCLEMMFAATCYTVAAGTIAIAGYAWAFDYLAGHIQ